MMVAEQKRSGVSLGELITGVGLEADRSVAEIVTDSRQIRPGSVFFARRGTKLDASAFIEEAIRMGAVAVVREGAPGIRMLAGDVPEICVADLAEVTGQAAHRFYGEPSSVLQMIGVTGTNGKTSVSHFVAHALSVVEPSLPAAGIIGTLGYGALGALEPGTLTTPDVVDLHRILAEMRTQGVRSVAMEVSSHALSQGRVAGVRFDTAVFTNLTRDHLDFHGSMSAYADAKAQLFKRQGLRCAVINSDDAFGRELLTQLPSNVDVFAYSLDAPAGDVPVATARRLEGRLNRADHGGIDLKICFDAEVGDLSLPLIGPFNGQNVLAALAVLLSMGVSFSRGLQLLRDIPSVPGRMQKIAGPAGAPLVVVDYSHTPGALAAALKSLRAHCSGQLWCVFGCGGDRDRGKRAQMGEVAEALADMIVLTDDNPRTEDGNAIIDDIAGGISAAARAGGSVMVERDRAAAIVRAVNTASEEDVVLVAGKGHEAYQEVMGIRLPFSDASAVGAALAERQS